MTFFPSLVVSALFGWPKDARREAVIKFSGGEGVVMSAN